MIKKLIWGTLATLFWIAVWFIAALAVGKELILPSPISVAARMLEFFASAAFYETILHSLARVVLGMVTGAIIGLIGGALTAFSPFVRNLFSPVLSVVKSTPIASFIILLFLWLDRDTVACVISALIVLPVVWSNVESGILSTDKALLEMADAYKMTKLAKLRHVYAPSALPYFTASLRSSLGMSWKAGIAAEALILPTISIGKMIFQSKYNLETVDLFAWTVVVIILSVVIEKLMVNILDRISRGKKGSEGGVSVG
jgi:NitT/TauT family transport system permease protein